MTARQRYRLIAAPAHVTVLGRPYYYFWDDQPGSDHGPLTRIGKYGSLVVGHDGQMADGDTPEEARTALQAMGLNEKEILR